MNIWLLMICMGLVTYLPRVLPLTTINEEALPGWARRGLTYVPVAVLSAIISSQVVPSEDWFIFTLDARLIAGLVAVGVAWYTHSALWTLGIGMAVLLLAGGV